MPGWIEGLLGWCRQPAMQNFGIALAGSLSAEAIKIVRAYESGRRLPGRYSKLGFWFARIALAVGAGVFAGSSSSASGYLAFYIGFSFPTLLESVTVGQQEPPEEPTAPPS